jgi:hypothetical protein
MRTGIMVVFFVLAFFALVINRNLARLHFRPESNSQVVTTPPELPKTEPVRTTSH